jgi:hypothetical protein
VFQSSTFTIFYLSQVYMGLGLLALLRGHQESAAVIAKDNLHEVVKFSSFRFVHFQWVHALKFIWGWVC